MCRQQIQHLWSSCRYTEQCHASTNQRTRAPSCSLSVGLARFRQRFGPCQQKKVLWLGLVENTPDSGSCLHSCSIPFPATPHLKGALLALDEAALAQLFERYDRLSTHNPTSLVIEHLLAIKMPLCAPTKLNVKTSK